MPAPVSAIEMPLLIDGEGFPDLTISSARKPGNFFHVATDATANSIGIPDLCALRPKNGASSSHLLVQPLMQSSVLQRGSPPPPPLSLLRYLGLPSVQTHFFVASLGPTAHAVFSSCGSPPTPCLSLLRYLGLPSVQTLFFVASPGPTAHTVLPVQCISAPAALVPTSLPWSCFCSNSLLRRISWSNRSCSLQFSACTPAAARLATSLPWCSFCSTLLRRISWSNRSCSLPFGGSPPQPPLRPKVSTPSQSESVSGTPCMNLTAVLRKTGDQREGRKVNEEGVAHSQKHRAFVRLPYRICADLQLSAIKASKKSAIPQSIRLQRPELRLCAISLLIVNTRSNQNVCAVVPSVVEGLSWSRAMYPSVLCPPSSAPPPLGFVREFQPRCQFTIHGCFRDRTFTLIPTYAFPAT